jgi:hypothetical protein
MLQRALTILWPAFLVAGLAEACFFALFDPVELPGPGGGLTPAAVHTLFFLFFWFMCALASMLTYYLARLPSAPEPPF